MIPAKAGIFFTIIFEFFLALLCHESAAAQRFRIFSTFFTPFRRVCASKKEILKNFPPHLTSTKKGRIHGLSQKYFDFFADPGETGIIFLPFFWIFFGLIMIFNPLRLNGFGILALFSPIFGVFSLPKEISKKFFRRPWIIAIPVDVNWGAVFLK